jgi:hypothetical protein
MKTIKFTAFLFYRYYSTGTTKDIPYASMLCAMVMLVGLHIFQIIILFDLKNILPISIENPREMNFLIIMLCLVPIFLFFLILIKKSDLKKLHYDSRKIKRGNNLLVVYIVASILLIPLIALIKNGHL